MRITDEDIMRQIRRLVVRGGKPMKVVERAILDCSGNKARAYRLVERVAGEMAMASKGGKR